MASDIFKSLSFAMVTDIFISYFYHYALLNVFHETVMTQTRREKFDPGKSDELIP
jgi:hypothetical protein